MSTGEFSVYWWDPEGHQNDELRFVDVEEAMRAAYRLSEGPVARIVGVVERVIVTDGGDLCVFEWKRGVGVTYPTPEELESVRNET